MLARRLSFRRPTQAKTSWPTTSLTRFSRSFLERWEYLKPLYLRDLPDATPEKLDAAVARIRASSDLGDALKDADIVIEAVPERLDIKQQTWEKVGELAPAKDHLLH